MEKNQYRLVIEVLEKLNKEQVLDKLILIGSWTVYFYQEFFHSKEEIYPLKTRDMDFLIPNTQKINVTINIPEVLKPLGFVSDIKGLEGYLQLQHPDLLIEFLVPEKGKGLNQSVFVKNLGINAQPLRYLILLTEKTIKVPLKNFYITLPDPIHFALHKLIIAQKRKNDDKRQKDIDLAVHLFQFLIKHKKEKDIRKVYEELPKKWQKLVQDSLRKNEWMKFVGMVESGDKHSSISIDEIVYGTKD